MKYVIYVVAMMTSLCFSGPFDRMAKSAPTCQREFHHQCWRDPWQHVMGGLCHFFSNQPVDQLLDLLTATVLQFFFHLGCLITVNLCQSIEQLSLL